MHSFEFQKTARDNINIKVLFLEIENKYFECILKEELCSDLQQNICYFIWLFLDCSQYSVVLQSLYSL